MQQTFGCLIENFVNTYFQKNESEEMFVKFQICDSQEHFFFALKKDNTLHDSLIFSHSQSLIETLANISVFKVHA